MMLVSSIGSFVNSSQVVPVASKNRQNDNHFGQVQNRNKNAVSERSFISKVVNYVTSVFSPKSREQYQDKKFSAIV